MQFPDLTAAQLRVLRFFIDFTEQHGKAPTYSEAAADLGITTTSVGFHLGKLESAGYVTRRPGSRGVCLTEKATASPPAA